MASRILTRIVAETGIPGLADILAQDLSGSDLQSLLLHVFEQRAGGLREGDLVRASERALLAPSRVSARRLNQFDQVAFTVAHVFEPVDLSPVAPLGLNHLLGAIDQNNVLSTIRSAEVLGDPTPALALECARRRRDAKVRSGGAIRLCASARVIR